MPDTVTKVKLRVGGMVCRSCEKRIEKRLASLPGIAGIRADHAAGIVDVSHDPEKTSLETIGTVLDKLGYKQGGIAENPPGRRNEALRLAGLLFALLGGYIVLERYGALDFLNIFPEAETGMGYGMVFVVGLLTSAHCIAMCGGINLSQSVSRRDASGAGKPFAPTLLYGAGRVLSYTVIGSVAGGIGGAVGFSGSVKGMVQIVAGVFMILMGIKLTGLFPSLSRLVPSLPGRFKSGSNPLRRGPFVVGLLNGLMPCGPLQTMQLFALSTGSPVQGALSMLTFAAGTLPLTMGLGALAACLGRRFASGAIRVGAVLVFVMGAGMLMNGLRLSGFAAGGFDSGGEAVAAEMADGVQYVETELSPGAYQAIRIVPGVPLRWNMHVENAALNGCNNRIFIPAYGLEKRLSAGDNIIEFTPAESGVFPYTCWMGMIASRIIVGDADGAGDVPAIDADILPMSLEAADDAPPWL